MPQILQVLYDKDIVSEDAILAWAEEKQDADDNDRVFLKQSEPFIQVTNRFLLTSVSKREWSGLVFVDFRYDELCVHFTTLIYLFMFRDFSLVAIGSGCISKAVDDDSMAVSSIG